MYYWYSSLMGTFLFMNKHGDVLRYPSVAAILSDHPDAIDATNDAEGVFP